MLLSSQILEKLTPVPSLFLYPSWTALASRFGFFWIYPRTRPGHPGHLPGCPNIPQRVVLVSLAAEFCTFLGLPMVFCSCSWPSSKKTRLACASRAASGFWTSPFSIRIDAFIYPNPPKTYTGPLTFSVSFLDSTCITLWFLLDLSDSILGPALAILAISQASQT